MNSISDERLVPERSDYETLWEHVARYAFSCTRVRGKAVLDIACGEGYGTHSLSRVASNVIGVDIDESAVRSAAEKYGLDCRLGKASEIPVENSSVDCVVSFETIEHLEDPAAFTVEVLRVLKPEGEFILSTPNKDIYHAGDAANPYHLREFSLSEICELLSPHFAISLVMGQSFRKCPLDSLEEWIGRISPGLKASFHSQVTRRLINRYTPGVTTTSATELRGFIEAIPSRHRSFLWMLNRLALRKVKPASNPACTYFIIVATKK